jgi:hypothetical protein
MSENLNHAQGCLRSAEIQFCDSAFSNAAGNHNTVEQSRDVELSGILRCASNLLFSVNAILRFSNVIGGRHQVRSRQIGSMLVR